MMRNILNNFTIRSLKLNIKRTIATSIGIILSTALICAVAGVFASFQQTLIQHAIMLDGDYHTLFYDIPKDKQKYILENRNIKSSFITQGIGYAKLEGSINNYKPYLYLMEFDKEALNNFGLILIDGRMPENSNELLISEHIESNGGVKYKIGDSIELEIGKRKLSDGYELHQENPYNNPKDYLDKNYEEEHLEISETRKFTVVGIIERPNLEIEQYSAPGFTIITTLENVKDNANIAVKFENIRESYDLTKEMSKDLKCDYHTNSELLRWSGVTRSDSTIKMLYSLAGIVIGIIVVSSVFVIRNSFAISITEKMKQYGMFSSIGATKKQIKNNVLFEGMILGIISIPIGILSGIFATFVLVKITTALIGGIVSYKNLTFVFKMPILAIVISILLGFLTIYLSCIFSARRASKISPIDAIRSNDEIKIKAKKIKTPKIINKLFGIGGEIAYKNLKRNRKKYRTTVISLVVSITVFISLNTFMNYTFGMTSTYYEERNYNVLISAYYPVETQETETRMYKNFQNIASKYNLKEYSIKRNMSIEANIFDKLTDDYKKIYSTSKEDGEHFDINIISLGKEAYNKYLKKIGAKYDECKNGIIYCKSYIYNQEAERVKAININTNDEISGTIVKNNENIKLKVLKVAEEGPSSGNYAYGIGQFIISDELMDKFNSYYCNTMEINSSKPDELCKSLEEEHDNLSKEDYFTQHITNYEEDMEEEKRMILLISIFLYGFIIVITLIGVTNIFNTITTNMNLRSKEFAMLKSIGMTKKEFNKMINLESIFYGVKSLIIGIALGLGISYWIYSVVIGAESTSGLKFIFPTLPIIISIIFISIIVGIIMKYSLNKINKQNIIDTIRNDNI